MSDFVFLIYGVLARKHRSAHSIAVMLLATLAVGGCYKPLSVSIPRIATPNEAWSLKVRCASQGCVQKNDVLVGENMEIEIEPYNHGWAGMRPFVISLRFRMPDDVRLVLDTSKVCLAMPMNKQACARAARNVSFHTSERTPSVTADYIASPISLPDESVASSNKRRSIDLIFDTPTPPVEEQFSLSIRGLSKGGKPINVPLVFFSKGER